MAEPCDTYKANLATAQAAAPGLETAIETTAAAKEVALESFELALEEYDAASAAATAAVIAANNNTDAITMWQNMIMMAGCP